MLACTSRHPDLDTARNSVDAAATRVALRLDAGLARACGTALALVADVTAADLDVARVNAALRAAGCADALPTASERTQAVVPAALPDALWMALKANPGEARRGRR